MINYYITAERNEQKIDFTGHYEGHQYPLRTFFTWNSKEERLVRILEEIIKAEMNDNPELKLLRIGVSKS
ncbi:MAG: hypothetical protein AABX48_03545 [Nanoarchaeota archaeon]